MRKRTALIAGLFLVLLLPCLGQVNGQPISPTQVTLPLLNPPLPVTNASVQLVGNPGPNTFYFWIVSSFPIGNAAPAGPFILQNAPITLTSSNYAQISWQPVLGATSYDVLMTTTAAPPTGACGCAKTTGTSSTTYNAQSNSTSAYTVTTVDPNTFAITIQNVQLSAGVSIWQFVLANGTVIGSLDSGGNLTVNSCTGCGGGGGGSALWPITVKTTSYNIASGDFSSSSTVGKLLVMNSGSAQNFVLPSTAPTTNGACVVTANIGAGGTLTLNPNGRTINGASGNLLIGVNTSFTVCSDGSNYYTIARKAINASEVGPPTYATDTGAANAYVITLATPPAGGLQGGLTVSALAANSNTGASTLNVNSLGVTPLTRIGGAALSSGDITANCVFTAKYNPSSGNFELQSPLTVTSAQLPATVVQTNQNNTYNAGTRQKFQASSTSAGISNNAISAAPSTQSTWDEWLESDTHHKMTLDDASNPSVQGYVLGKDLQGNQLWNTQGIQGQIALSQNPAGGTVNEVKQDIYACIGDSHCAGFPGTTSGDSWFTYFNQIMQAQANGGSGWQSAAGGCVPGTCNDGGNPGHTVVTGSPHNPPASPGGCTITLIYQSAATELTEFYLGTDQSQNSPDLTALQTATTGDGFDMTCPNVTQFVVMTPVGSSLGKYTWAVDSGSTTTVDESVTTGCANTAASPGWCDTLVDNSGSKYAEGQHTLHIRSVNTTSTYWFGVNAQDYLTLSSAATYGAIGHKLSANSSLANEFSANPFLAAQLGGNALLGTGLGVNTIYNQFSANERTAGETMAQAVIDWTNLTNLELTVASGGATTATPDILWSSDPANNITTCTGGCKGSMGQFATAMQVMTWTLPSTVYISLHKLFNDTNYTNAVNHFLYYTDGIHLSSTGKGAAANYIFSQVPNSPAQRMTGYTWQSMAVISNTVPVTDFTSNLSPKGRLYRCAGVGACTYTLPSTPPAGCIEFIQTGTGQMSINPNGVTMSPPGSTATVTFSQYEWAEICGDGVSAYTLKGGNKYTNMGAHKWLGNNTGSAATAAPEAIGTSDVTPGQYQSTTTTNSGDAYTVTLSPAATALSNGLYFCFTPSANNTTTTPTVAVSGLAATTITKNGQSALAAADLITTKAACVLYDGTDFELQNPATSAGGGANGYDWTQQTAASGYTLVSTDFSTTASFGTNTNYTVTLANGTYNLPASLPAAGCARITNQSSLKTLTISPTGSGGTADVNGSTATFTLPACISTVGCAQVELCSDGVSHYKASGINAALGTGVSSFTGDGTLLNNSASAGAVTATLATAGAHKFWGNNTSSSSAPGYDSIGTSDVTPGQYQSTTTTNSGDAYTVTLSPAAAALSNGLYFCFLPSANNTTTTPTIAVSGLAATTVAKWGGPLVAGDMGTTGPACVLYDGTYFELQTPVHGHIIYMTPATITMTASSGDIGGTITMVTPAANTHYRFSATIAMTAACAGSPSGTSTTGIRLAFTDVDSGQSIGSAPDVTFLPYSVSSGATAGNMTTGSGALTSASVANSTPRVFYAASGVAVTYTVNVATNTLSCSTSYPVLKVWPALEAF